MAGPATAWNPSLAAAVGTETRKRTAGAKRTGIVMPTVSFRVMVGVNMLFNVGLGPPARPVAPVLLGCGAWTERGVVLGLASRSEIRPIVPAGE